MKSKNYNVYSDPGHAWAKVKYTEIVKLGIQHNISACSYTKGDNVYLEEDCDLFIFVEALSKIGIKPTWIQHNTEKCSKIRSYNRYIAV
jgi:hypothetical protein